MQYTKEHTALIGEEECIIKREFVEHRVMRSHVSNDIITVCHMLISGTLYWFMPTVLLTLFHSATKELKRVRSKPRIQTLVYRPSKIPPQNHVGQLAGKKNGLKKIKINSDLDF